LREEEEKVLKFLHFLTQPDSPTEKEEKTSKVSPNDLSPSLPVFTPGLDSPNLRLGRHFTLGY
jgi:hypothetical protein